MTKIIQLNVDCAHSEAKTFSGSGPMFCTNCNSFVGHAYNSTTKTTELVKLQ